MSIFRSVLATSAAVAAAMTFAGPQANAQDGGVVDVAIIGEPDTLDPMMSTKDVVSIVTQHFYETLFTFNANWEVVPLLAETMPQISDDGRTYTIAIRQGITFHDGSTMDAHDVVDSLNRWTQVASRGKGAADKIESISAVDDHTVQISLNVHIPHCCRCSPSPIRRRPSIRRKTSAVRRSHRWSARDRTS